jgi:hypothetical protein
MKNTFRSDTTCIHSSTAYKTVFTPLHISNNLTHKSTTTKITWVQQHTFQFFCFVFCFFFPFFIRVHVCHNIDNIYCKNITCHGNQIQSNFYTTNIATIFLRGRQGKKRTCTSKIILFSPAKHLKSQTEHAGTSKQEMYDECNWPALPSIVKKGVTHFSTHSISIWTAGKSQAFICILHFYQYTYMY